MADVRTDRIASTLPRAVALIGGIGYAGLGIWALAAPSAFFESIALFEPYNRHLIQDIGAFQIGLSAVLLLAAISPRPDALAVALLGTGIGSIAHLASHVAGIGLGGNPAVDLPSLSLLGGVLVAAGLVRWRWTPGRR